MADITFPHILYSTAEPTGRIFDTQEALDAASAEGPWYMTPHEAADAAAQAAEPTPAPEPEPRAEETPPRRSHR